MRRHPSTTRGTGRLAAVLRALLPGGVRRDLFDPALHDLQADAVRTGRGTTLGTIGLFSSAGAWRRWRSSTCSCTTSGTACAC